MKRREFLKQVAVTPLVVQLGLTAMVPKSEVPAEELPGKCHCSQSDEYGAKGCICKGVDELDSSDGVPGCSVCGWFHQPDAHGACMHYRMLDLKYDMYQAISGHGMSYSDFVCLSMDEAYSLYVKHYT